MHKVQVTPVIGLPEFTGWAQVTSSPSRSAVWVVSVSGEHAGNVGRDVIDQIESSRQSMANQPADVYEFIKLLVSETEEKGCQLSCIVCSVGGPVAVFAAIRGTIILKRPDKTGQLLNADDQLQLITGKVSTEDVYILATTQARRFFGEIHQKLSMGYETDTIVASITPGIRLEGDTATVALAFVEVGQEIAEVIPPEEPSRVASSVTNLDLPKVQPSSEKELVMDEELSANQTSMAAPAIEIQLTSTPVDANSFREDAVSTASYSTKFKERFLGVVKGFGQLSHKGLKSMSSLLIYFKQASKVGLSSGQGIGTQLKIFGSKLSKLQPFSREIYVTGDSRRHILKWLVPILFLMLVGGGGYTWYRQKIKSQKEQVRADLAPVLADFALDKIKAEQDPIGSRELVQGVVDRLQSLATTYQNQPAALAEIKPQLEQAQALLTEVSGKKEVSELPIFFDARSLVSDFVIGRVGMYNNAVALADLDKKQVLTLDLATKDIQVRDIPVEGSIITTALRDYDDTVWILTDENQVNRLRLQSTGGPSAIISDDDSLFGAKLMQEFGEALYILNPENRTIYKFIADDETFKDPIRWLRSAPGLDLGTVSSMAIDGDIWLTTRSGEVHRLRSGNEQEFSISGLSESFNSPLVVVTKAEADDLYILEADQDRIVILHKDGTFVREIKSSSLASATAIFINEDKSRLFAVSGSLIFEIAL